MNFTYDLDERDDFGMGGIEGQEGQEELEELENQEKELEKRENETRYETKYNEAIDIFNKLKNYCDYHGLDYLSESSFSCVSDLIDLL